MGPEIASQNALAMTTAEQLQYDSNEIGGWLQLLVN